MKQSGMMMATLAMIAIVSIGVFLFTIQQSTLVFFPQSSSMVASASVSPLVATSSLPLRLIIPSISINAHIQYVGVNTHGNMKAPSNFTDVAWYEPGSVPGSQGSAVIAGHVDNGLALNGVFKHLSDLHVGNDIYIQTAGGTRLHFVVSDIQTYPYQSVPVQILFGQNDGAHLNLITCEGAWVAGHDTYDHRLVVYTTLVTS